MATLQMLINLFPAETAGIQVVATLLLAAVALGLGVTFFVVWRRASRRRAAGELALARGLSARSAQFFAQAFQHEATGTAESLLSAPDLLVKRLVLAIVRQRGRDAALQFAAEAAQLLDELSLRTPAFDGAPRPCEAILLTDPTEPAGPGVLVFVGIADERNLVVVSAFDCPWPLRRNLMAMPQPLPGVGVATSTMACAGMASEPLRGAEAPSEAETVKDGGGTNSDSGPPRRVPFEVALLLRPMPPLHEWVFTHALVETITNRRATVRVPCRIETVTLPDSGEPLQLRQRLQREEPVALDELRHSRAWSQRLTVTVVDLSADGARLILSQPLAKHQRLHLLLARPDDSVLALPLAEVMDSRHDEDGRTVAGVRFIGVRMKERLRLAEYVRALAAPVGGPANRLPRGPR